MSTAINGSINGCGSIQEIIENATSDSSEDRKDLKQKKQIASDKRINALGENISKLQEQKSKLSKASKFGFIGALVSNIINVVTVALCSIFPVAAPVIQKVGQLTNTAVQTGVSKLVSNKQLQAQEAQIDAHKWQKIAETEDKKIAEAEQDMTNNRQQLENMKKKLEVALSNYQQAQSAVIKC